MRLFLLISLLLASTATAPSPVAQSHATARPSRATAPEGLFSRRALRRARLLIQMRMMQFHEERLECIRAALRRQLPASLWPEEPTPSRGIPDARAAVAPCEEFRLTW